MDHSFTGRLKHAWRKETLWEGAGHVLTGLGTGWLFIEFTAWVLPSLEIDRAATFLLVLTASALWATHQLLPPVSFRRVFKGKNLSINVEVGDLLDPSRNQHIAILSSEYFDSCTETAIAAQSVKGQLISRYFQHKSEFDERVDSSLRTTASVGTHNPDKTKVGPNRTVRYPIGTTAAVSIGQRLALLVVAATMDIADRGRTRTSANDLWVSLNALWRAAHRDGHRGRLSMPLWGANLGGAPGNRAVLFETILCSFAAATGHFGHTPTNDLTIVIWKGDYSPAEFRHFEKILLNFEP
jgi:hypothetical protein